VLAALGAVGATVFAGMEHRRVRTAVRPTLPTRGAHDVDAPVIAFRCAAALVVAAAVASWAFDKAAMRAWTGVSPRRSEWPPPASEPCSMRCGGRNWLSRSSCS
jgi:hypothetical protein